MTRPPTYPVRPVTHPFDANWTVATARGNQGGTFKLGLIESDPNGAHRVTMQKWHSLIVPRSQLIVGDAARGPAEVWRLTQLGCGAIAMPFVFDDPEPSWVPYLVNCAANGVLLFAGAGNNTAKTPTPSTLFPASHPAVYSCAACFPATGALDPHGSPPGGRIDFAVPCGFDGSSGASMVMACIAVQWLGAGGVRLFSEPAARQIGFRAWMTGSCKPLPGGRGVVPRAGSL